MILIVGGRSQGKQAFAMKLYPELTEDDFADGRTADEAALLQKNGLRHFEGLVRRLLEEGRDPEAFVRTFLSARPEVIILADEIGCGIIPMDPFEETWRETAGRLLCTLAQEAEAFYRVTCGVGQRLK